MEVSTRFTTPCDKDVREWLRQTRGVLTNEVRAWLGLPPIESRSVIKYEGPLSLAQQYYVLCELNNCHPFGDSTKGHRSI